MADLEERVVALESATNNAFLILCGIFVFVMQVGFAMLEVGSVRKVYTRNILFKNVLDACVGGLVWYAVGYAFAFGDQDPQNRFIGNSYFFMERFPDGINTFPFWFYQYTFAATSVTIISGAVAERLKVSGYLFLVIFMTGWVYPVVAHWVWSPEGFLSAEGDHGLWDVGVIDLAGCLAVHSVGGWAALIGAFAIGYRGQHTREKDKKQFPPRFEKVDGKWQVNDMEASSESFAALGVLLLWFGWYGFNAGSIIAIVGRDELAGRVVANTTISPCAGAVANVLLGRAFEFVEFRIKGSRSTGTWNLGDALNGVLAGLVAITAGAATAKPWAAVIAGVVASLVYKILSVLLVKLRIDDPVDAFAVHAGCGFWGVVFSALFAEERLVKLNYGDDKLKYGLFLGGGAQRLLIHLTGLVVVIAWTVFWVSIFFAVLMLIDRIAVKRFKIPLFVERGAVRKGLVGFGHTVKVKPQGSTFVIPMHDMLPPKEDNVDSSDDSSDDEGGPDQSGKPSTNPDNTMKEQNDGTRTQHKRTDGDDSSSSEDVEAGRAAADANGNNADESDSDFY